MPTPNFSYKHHLLHVENVSLEDIADTHGTPAYIYSRNAIQQRWQQLDNALAGIAHKICYAVKANSNIMVLDCLARLGSDFDVVSIGEMSRVLSVGVEASKIVYSGVGKTNSELEYALTEGISCIDVESAAELKEIVKIAKLLQLRAPVALRVNPDVDAETHPYISTGLSKNKFGIPIDQAEKLMLKEKHNPHLEWHGIACHIGSQMTSLEPLKDCIERMWNMVLRLRQHGFSMPTLNLGGGIGVVYRDESPPNAQAYGDLLTSYFADKDILIKIEPGRLIVGDAGVLLTRVIYQKSNGDQHFIIVDAAMNDLIRPALYDGWHNIKAVKQNSTVSSEQKYNLVGPVCESADFLALDRAIKVQRGDLVAIETAGAYAAVMSSNYNSRPRAPELLVDGDTVHLAKRRETINDMLRLENKLP